MAASKHKVSLFISIAIIGYVVSSAYVFAAITAYSVDCSPDDSLCESFRGEVNIENTVSVSANSGGNSASAGEIVEGTQTVELFIETIVNGEVVELIEESVTGDEPVSIKKETRYESSEGSVEVITAAIVETESGEAKATDSTKDGPWGSEQFFDTARDDSAESEESDMSFGNTVIANVLKAFSNIFTYVFSLFRT